jgi:autotransporter translocation and assembly factor TamB
MRFRVWRVLFGILIALVVPVAVALVLVVLILSVPPVGRFALSQALTRVGPMVGAEIRFGRIEGNIMRSIAINDVAVRFGSDSLKAKTVTLTYDPWASIRDRSFSASSASAVEPRFFLSSSRPRSGQAGEGENRYPKVQVGQFRILNGTVFLDTVRRLDSVDLALNLRSVPEQMLVDVSKVRARLCREGVVLNNLSGRARLTPDSLLVADLVAATAGSYVRAGLRMAFKPNGLAVQLESLSVSLPELTSAVSVGQKAAAAPAVQLPSVHGRLRIKGDAKLAEKEPSGDVRYSAEGLVLRDIKLPTIGGNLKLGDSIVQLTMSGRDSALGGADVSGWLDLRRLGFSGSARLTGIAIRQIDSSLPDLRVNAELKASGRGADSIAAEVTATVPDFGIERLTAAGTYVKAVERVSVEQFELSGPVGVASGSGTWEDGHARVDIRMEDFDLGLSEKLGLPPVKGRATGSVSLSGTADTIDALAQLAVADLSVAGIRAASASASLAVAVGRELSGQARVSATQASYGSFAFDSVQLAWQEQMLGLGAWWPGVQVVADGNARLARDGIGVDVAALRVTAGKEALTFDDAVRLRLQSDSFSVRLAASGLAGGDVRAAFATAAGQPPRIEAAVGRVDLDKLKTLLGLDLEMSGTVSLDVVGSDTFDVTVDAERLSIPSAEVELSRVLGVARVSGTRAELDHLWLVHQDSGAVPETSVVTGSLEYKTEGGFELGAADLRVRLRNPGTWVVFYLKPTMELQRGTVFGDLTLTGSLAEPRFGGRVRISRARLGVPLIGATFDRVNAELVFDRNRISVEKLTGRSDHGNVLVTGFVDIGERWQLDSLRFHGDFSGTTINPQPEIYGVIGGSLEVDWALGRPFSLSGTVDVEEALVAFGFGQSAGTGAGGPDTTFVFDVRVRGERNLWFRNQLVDIEFAGDLTVRKTRKEMYYSGELTSRQGTVYYLDHALRVTSGSVQLENINTVDPDFDITAELPIRAISDTVAAPDKVILTITGTLAKPDIAFRSEPPGWDETQIISYLTLNVTPEQLSAPEMKDRVTGLLGNRLLGYFQNMVSKRARGFVNLDYLEFESELSGSKETKVTVGKYVGRNLYVSYTQNFTGDLNPSFRVEYYINRKNQIVAEGTASDQYRTSVRYQLKLRY